MKKCAYFLSSYRGLYPVWNGWLDLLLRWACEVSPTIHDIPKINQYQIVSFYEVKVQGIYLSNDNDNNDEIIELYTFHTYKMGVKSK